MLTLAPIDRPPILCRPHLVQNLKFVYALIVASEDLTRFAAESSGMAFFKRKLAEETGHAQWLLDDILNMGETPPKLDHDAACIAGAQFYYIRYVSPLMLLGYMAALESNPMPPSDVDALEAMYGKLPTLRYHAEHDVLHARDVRDEIAKIHDADLRERIAYNELCTAAHVARIMRDRFGGLDA